ncbi:hypothetical protein MMC28_009478 [Mycoblastus sanguinarius]|nr:hypothetical protein [Mycoblastus sanguinarius]
MTAQSEQVTFDSRYVSSLLLNESNIQSRDYAAGRELLLSYSEIPPDAIATHVADIQRRAYALCPYPCIGLLRFLICSLAEHYLYPTILSRLHHGALYLDIGCCFAQDIRRLAHDGAPTDNCVGVDLESGFFALSEALFLDRGRLSARFFGADVFCEEDAVWTNLQSSVDIVHASSFFHLFGLPKQRRIARMIARIIKAVPNSVVLGLQLAAAGEAQNIPVVSEEEPTYCHSPATMRALWDDAGRETGLEGKGLRWSVEVRQRKIPESHKIGLLANPKLVEIMWNAKLTAKDG